MKHLYIWCPIVGARLTGIRATRKPLSFRSQLATPEAKPKPQPPASTAPRQPPPKNRRKISTHPTTMRLFVGLPIPPELAQTLTRRAQTIAVPKGRRTAPEDLHLTLVFLGEVPEPSLPPIEHELSELNFAPLQIKFTGLSTFPRAGVLIAEIEPTRPLLHLQATVAAAMARCGFPPRDPEPRPYHPHVTLARFHGSLRLTKSEQALPLSPQLNFTADSVNLYRSHPGPTGSTYEILAQKKCTKPSQPLTPS